MSVREQIVEMPGRLVADTRAAALFQPSSGQPDAEARPLAGRKIWFQKRFVRYTVRSGEEFLLVPLGLIRKKVAELPKRPEARLWWIEKAG